MAYRIFRSLDDIRNVVEEVMSPKNNKFIGDFKMVFKMSSKSWESNYDFIVLHFTRGIHCIVEKASLQEEIDYLNGFLDPNYEYFDDHKMWKSQVELRERIKRLEDENKIWTLQNLSNKLTQL
jgi:hypothetical protein